MTLIEILAVIAVIIILFSILMGLTGAASLKADKVKVFKDFAVLESVIEEDRISRGRYGSAAEVATAIADKKSVDIRLQDPWGASYLDFYTVTPNQMSYTFGSPGPDGKVGKAFFDDDGDGTVDNINEFGLFDDILNTSRNE